MKRNVISTSILLRGLRYLAKNTNRAIPYPCDNCKEPVCEKVPGWECAFRAALKVAGANEAQVNTCLKRARKMS